MLSLSTNGSDSSPALVLGTVYIRPEEREPSQGRILLFSVLQAEGDRGAGMRSLDTLASQEVGGCVYALAHLSENHIVAAINSSVRFFAGNIRMRSRRLSSSAQVVLFKATDNSVGELTPLRLERVAEWNHSHFVTNLVVDGEHILVGDAISSVSVLRWNDGLGRLESVARDYGPLWPTAIEGTGNGIIGANVRGHEYFFICRVIHPLLFSPIATFSRSRCRECRNVRVLKKTAYII